MGGGLFCARFALALQVAVGLCLRLDVQVTSSVRGKSRESTHGFLVLASSTRTLKSSGVPARRVPAGGFCVGMLPLACSTQSRALVVGAGCFGSVWLGGGCRACTIDCLAFRLTAARAFLPRGSPCLV